MRLRDPARLLAASLLAVGLSSSRPAKAQLIATASAARTLGAPAVSLLEARAPVVSAIVELPLDVDPIAYGLRPVAPGFAVLHGDAAAVAGFARAHADWPLEIAPPLRKKLDQAVAYVGASPSKIGADLDGRGVYVGIVDTGVDPLHPDFVDATGHTRIAWLLDLSQSPRAGNVLDQTFGGRVYDRVAVDAILAAGQRAPDVPDDWDGHGTHVAGIAASDGGPSKKYVGMAPGAELVVVCASRQRNGDIQEADAILGTKFVFDRATLDGRPAVANLSLGSQFGPHDGTSTFEKGLAALAQAKGRAVVVAASNEGDLPIHTSLRVTPHARFEVPIRLPGKDTQGAAYDDAYLYLYLKNRSAGSLRIGLLGPNGDSWMDPVDVGQAFQATPATGVQLVVANDAPSAQQIPTGSHGAFMVAWGKLPAGDMTLTLEGDASVEAWVEGGAQSADPTTTPYFPRGGQIEGTIGVPASSPGVLAAGCVDLRQTYKDMAGDLVKIDAAPLGQRCFFSSAGPNAAGALRPDVLAPGFFVISSLAGRAYQAAPQGEFATNQIVDGEHAVLAGTSMSSPFVAGAAALLLQRDPTLDQETIRAALQAGARPLADDVLAPTTSVPTYARRDYADGAGILDVAGALSALDRRASPPRATQIQLRFGASFLALDGTPVESIAIARDANGGPADVAGDLTVTALGAQLVGAVEHPMPGLYRFTLTVAPGQSTGAEATVQLDGGGVTTTRALTVAADRWDAHYGITAAGGCAFGGPPEDASDGEGLALGALAIAALTARRRRSRPRSRAAT